MALQAVPEEEMPSRPAFSPLLLCLVVCCTQPMATQDGGADLVSSCTPCVSNSDCGSQTCAQSLSGGYCLAACRTTEDCSRTETCRGFTSFDGTQFNGCVATNGSCEMTTDQDAGAGADSGFPHQVGLDAGDEGAQDAGNGSDHDAGNQFVRDAGNQTHQDAGGQGEPDAGAFTSSITASGGGTESQLFFAVIGDTRPYNGDDTANYPASPPLAACTPSTAGAVRSTTAYCGVINKIYEDIQAMNPSPPVVISTGDYQYVTPGTGGAATQLGYYQTARNLYSGVEWPAMGNHECDGYTASNCASGCPSGDRCSGSNTENFLEFQKLFLQPIGETLPYYTRTITATDNSWKAHFIFVAPNYWNSTQQSWLNSQLSAAGASSTSNYVFVIHHEDYSAGNPSSLNTIETAEQPTETISIVGHSHTWNHGTADGSSGKVNAKQLLVGNGGVPSTSLQNLGYTTVLRQPNGTLVVTNYDYLTNQVVNTYTVTP